MYQSESLDRAIKQLGHASDNLENGSTEPWRERAATLVTRISLALRFPGQYEISYLATELEEELKKEQARRNQVKQ